MRWLGRAGKVGALLAAVAVAAVVPPGGSAHASAQRRTVNVLPTAVLAHRLGDAPAAQRWSVSVALTDLQLPAEQNLAAALVDPTSAQFRHFLSPQEWASRFALPAAVRDRTRSWLTAGGLSVGYTSPTGDLVQAEGTVAQIQHLFDVHLGRYQLGATEFLANDVAPAVPVDLPVASVIGLNNLQRFVPAKPIAVHPGAGVFSGVIDVKSLWSTYGTPASDEGQGVRMGVFMAGNTAPVIGSLRTFEAAEHLPKVPVRVVHAQPGPDADFTGDNDGGGEWMLDSQASTGMAPKVAGLDLYASKSLADADAVAEISYWANDTTAPTLMNASFGSCEDFPITSQSGKAGAQVAIGNMVQAALEKALMQAFAEGRTLFASSGDNGSSCSFLGVPVVGAGNGLVNQGLPGQTYPAASTYATAVGGTVLTQTKDHTRMDEQAWAFGGGGSDLFIPEAPWQRSEPNVNHPCLPTNPDGSFYAPGTICRGVPDLAALSGNSSEGLGIFNYNQPAAVGGTSLSSPLVMGMWARVVAAAKTPIGPAAPAIYHLDAAARARDFHDITSGEAGGNGLNVPGPGWDYTSGYGVPEVTALVTDLAGSTTPAHPNAGRIAEKRVAPERSGSCLPFGTSPAGNLDPTSLGESNESRDLTSASMNLASDGKSLVITFLGPHLGTQVPLEYQASFFQASWNYRDEPYLVTVTNTGGGTKAVEEKLGTSADPKERPKRNDVTAVYSAGTLTVTVPLSDIDNPTVGQHLENPVATSGVLVDLAVLALPQVQDAAGPDRDVILSEHCA